MPAQRSEAGAAIGKAPTPGSTMRSAARNALGIGREHRSRASITGFARGPLEGLGGGAQIAGAVVDDGDAHG